MKLWPMLALILLTGCAAKRHVTHSSPVGIPLNCIVGATDTAQCKQISADLAVCDGVVIKFACIQVKEKK